MRSVIKILNENPICVFRRPAALTLVHWLCDPSVRRLGLIKTCFGGMTRWVGEELARRRANNRPCGRNIGQSRIVVFDESQNANLATRVAIDVAAASDVVTLLMGDPNQNVCGDARTPFDTHPANHGLVLSQNITLRFGAAGAACYNRLATPETPLLQGLGPAVVYADAIPADAQRVVFVGRTNVGALVDALDSGCAGRLPVFVTESIQRNVQCMREWLSRRVFPHTGADSAGLVAAADEPMPSENGQAADVDDDDGDGQAANGARRTPWSHFYRYSSSARVRAFLDAFEHAALVPRGGPSGLPAHASCVMVTSTVSAVGSDLDGFCVVAARDCFAPGVARGHGVVALTRATGVSGVAVELHDAAPDNDAVAFDDAFIGGDDPFA